MSLGTHTYDCITDPLIVDGGTLIHNDTKKLNNNKAGEAR